MGGACVLAWAIHCCSNILVCGMLVRGVWGFTNNYQIAWICILDTRSSYLCLSTLTLLAQQQAKTTNNLVFRWSKECLSFLYEEELSIILYWQNILTAVANDMQALEGRILVSERKQVGSSSKATLVSKVLNSACTSFWIQFVLAHKTDAKQWCCW